MKSPALLFNKDYTHYQIQRGKIRKWIRKLYLRNIMPYINGKTVDFGCGVGEFLKMLPPGSIGFEINEATVVYCRDIGLNVQPYKPEIDCYQFKNIKKGEFNVFTMVHVLEHCADAEKILSIIFTSCARLDIKRIIIVVPGRKGFRSDCTHETFVDFQSFKKALTESKTNYVISSKRYFPFNRALIGNFFVHHELMVIFDKNNG